MKKTISHILPVTLLVLICAFAWSPKALAYFDQGPVGVSVGRQSISLEQGQSGNVSVTFSPAQSSQLPGCGMAECPQTCGEKECLDENGQCTCNGKTYQTYYAYAVVASSNTSVATAQYDDNGVVVINAVSPGTATITVTASLRQFTSTSATIAVTVEAASSSGDPETSAPSPVPSGQPDDSGNPPPEVTGTPVTDNPTPSSKPDASGDAPSGVSAIPITGNSAGETGGEEAPGASGEDAGGEEAPDVSEKPYTVIESDRGTIYFVPITEGKMGKDILTEIAGKDVYVDFQKKDAAENIQYAWEFCGADLTKAEDLVLTLDTGTTAFAGCPYGSPSDTLYISFAEDGPLPAEASLYLHVSEHFTDEETLYLYAYGEDGGLRLLADGISAENGYVAATLAFRENLILTAQELKPTAVTEEDNVPDEAEKTAAPDDTAGSPAKQGGISPAVIAAIVVVVLLILAAAVVIVFRRQKNRKGHTDD